MSKYVSYATHDDYSEAVAYVNAMESQGWSVVCPPFPVSYGLIDAGEEKTVAYADLWATVLHRD